MNASTGDLMLTDDLTAAIDALEDDGNADLIPFRADCPSCPQLHKKVGHGNNGTLILLRHLRHTNQEAASAAERKPAVVNFISWSKTNGLKAGGIPAIIIAVLAFMWYQNQQTKLITEKVETVVSKVTEQARQTARGLRDVTNTRDAVASKQRTESTTAIIKEIQKDVAP